MESFVFEGNWSFDIELQHLKGFGYNGSRQMLPARQGRVEVKIEDELNDEPDPTPAQLKAINYLLVHQQAILHAITVRISNEYENLKNSYGYQVGYDDDVFPPLNSPEDVRKIIGIRRIQIFLPEKEAHAYVGIEGTCTWNKEQGMGFLMHKDRIITFGNAADEINIWDAYRDNGTSEQKLQEWNGTEEIQKKPKKYLPHPKYGKLKPSQIIENKGYEYRLIERGYNQEFKQLVETGDITVNTVTGYLNMTFLERACQCNNEELAVYILGKGPWKTQSCIHYATRHANKNLVSALLDYGVSINEANHFGETPLTFIMSLISSHYFRGSTEEEISGLKDMVQWLIVEGADPYNKGRNQQNAFDVLANQSDKVKKEMTGFLERAVQQRV